MKESSSSCSPGRRLLRILLVSAYFRPHVGGVERFTETLARGLAGRGHEVLVLCCATEDGSPAHEAVDGYRVQRVRATNWLERRFDVPYPLPDPLAFVRRANALVPTFDVVHAHEARYPTTVIALLRGRAYGIPAVLTQHTGFVPQRIGALDAVQRVLGWAVGPAARRATAITCLNPDVAAWTTARWATRRAEILPVGVRAWDVEPNREAFQLPDDRLVVLFVGRDVHAKGLDLLLDALDPSYVVVAVTDARPAPRDGLRVFPFMRPERLRQLMASVDAFVLPSRAEGLPLALQEAMAAGLPVVTTMLPGYEHFFGQDDVSVVIPEPGSIRAALLRLASDPELRARLSMRSRAVAKRSFSEERFVDAYEALYGRLCNR